MKKPKIPIVGFLAKFHHPYLDDHATLFPFSNGDIVFVFGEIDKMPGHCVVADKQGKVYFGYHTSDFIRLIEDEI